MIILLTFYSKFISNKMTRSYAVHTWAYKLYSSCVCSFLFAVQQILFTFTSIYLFMKKNQIMITFFFPLCSLTSDFLDKFNYKQLSVTAIKKIEIEPAKRMIAMWHIRSTVRKILTLCSQNVECGWFYSLNVLLSIE